MDENDTINSQEVTAPFHQAFSQRTSYEIRVKDHLDPCWQEWFEGWTLTNLGNGEITLSRSNVDQSALHGTLIKIRDLNLTLISVTQKE